MTWPAHPPRVLFRVAAGPRVGFGHMVRAVSLAEAVGVPALLSVRGLRSCVSPTVRRLGAKLVPPGGAADVLDRVNPDVLVLDDRVARATAAWRRAARRRGVPVVSIHDLGLGLGDADLVVDGSLGATTALAHAVSLSGPRFAILNPRCLEGRRDDSAPRHDVAIALGGGPRRLAAVRLAGALRARRPGLRVAIAAGFVATDSRSAGGSIEWIAPSKLGAALAGCGVAVVGGGVTLYESLALGVPTVAAAVVPSQRPTVSAFAARGAVLDGGLLSCGPRLQRRIESAARRVLSLLDDDIARRRLTRAGSRLVDGRGADRVARGIERMLSSHRRSKAASQ
jgi:UDP-2,4-diacetamido-2,4,6-trideoxy-beta-L-altropyranose hydrolase